MILQATKFRVEIRNPFRGQGSYSMYNLELLKYSFLVKSITITIFKGVLSRETVRKVIPNIIHNKQHYALAIQSKS